MKFVVNTVAVLIITVLIAEAILRIVFPSDIGFSQPEVFWDHWRRASSDQTHAIADNFNSFSSYDSELGFIYNDVLKSELSFGDRKGFRIMLLGDSIMASQEFSKPLIAAIREHSNEELDFFNASTPGWDTLQEYLYLKNRGLKYKPNLVILQMCLNDFISTPVFWKVDDGSYRAFNVGRLGKYFNYNLVTSSRLLQRILYFYLQRFPFDSGFDYAKVYDSLLKISELAKRENFAFHVILLPFLRNPPSNYDIVKMKATEKIANQIFSQQDISNFLDLAYDVNIGKWKAKPADIVHPNEDFSIMISNSIVQKLNYK